MSAKHFDRWIFILLIATLQFVAVGSLRGQDHWMAVTKADPGNIPQYQLIRFRELPNDHIKSRLQGEGVILLQYQGNRMYWASVSSPEFSASKFPSISEHIKSPDLTNKQGPQAISLPALPSWAIPTQGYVSLQLQLAPDLAPSTIHTAFKEAGFRLQSLNPVLHSASITIRHDQVQQLGKLSFVFFVQPIDPPAEPENLSGTAQHRSNVLDQADGLGRQFDGSGVGIMLQDDGLIGPHIDYQGRVGEQFVDFNNGNHGDHIAGILHGSGNRDPLAAGTARGAELFVYDANSYAGFDSISLQNHYQQYGIRVVSTSYANGCNAGYTLLASEVDQLAIDYPGLLFVFSAGNTGSQDCGYGAGLGWGNITGGHKSGKNVLAIGSLNFQDQLASNSSRGPASDGRIKPDLCAKGVDVYSTIQNNQYEVNSGTSLACPAVAGVLAQLTHAYRSLNANNDPEGGLLKAMILNAADDLDDPGPDYKTGWGRLNALRAVEIMENNQFGTGIIGQGGNNNHSFQLPAGASELKVMVYWTDVPGAPGATKALVNDLDFTLTPPGGGTLNPFILDPTANSTNLDQPATTGIDTLNNMEQVVLQNPAGGTYSVQVAGSAVAMGPQAYYWVYSYSMQAPEITFPVAGASVVPGETVRVRWDAAGTASTFDLEYQTDPSGSWISLASSLAGNLRQTDWLVPNTVSGAYRIRISRGANADTSANFSVIGVPQNLNLAAVCADSITLDWDPVPGATSYEVSRLGTMYMDSIGTSPVDSLIVPNFNPLQEAWFSVKSLGPNGARGRRAVAIYKTAGVFNCVLETNIGLLQINNPGPQGIPSCMEGPHPVKLTLENLGTNAVSGFQVNYVFDGGTPVSEVYTDTIQPGTMGNFQFSQLLTIGLGNHSLEVWAVAIGDGNLFNDTLTQNFIAYSSSSVQPIFIEDFETQDTCSTNPNCEQTVCALSNGWWNAANGQTDDIDWRVDLGGTPTGGTGPTTDHNPGNGTGRYLYVEASNCFNREAHLISPCIDLSEAIDPKLIFWYHMNGSDIGRLHVDIYSSANRSWTLDATAPLVGAQSISWQSRQIDLNSFPGDVINIRFRAFTGQGNIGDIALDDIQIGDRPIAGFDWKHVPSDDSLLIQFTDESHAASFLSMDLGDSQTKTISNFVHHYTSPGTFQVRQVVANLCGIDTLIRDVSVYPLGQTELPGASRLQVNPNPAKELITIRLSESVGQTVHVELYSADGKLQHKVQRNPNGGQLVESFSVSHLPAGIYMLLVHSANFREAVKLGIL